MAPRLFADVALPIPVEHPFTYEVPEALADRAAIGMRALVPVLGRTETGYIVGLPESPGLEKIRRLLDLPDPSPVFSADMLELCKWVAEYYCCSLGEALQCALPAGMRARSVMRYTLLTGELGPGRFTERQRKAIAELYRRGPLTEGQLAAAVSRTALSNTLQSLVARGILAAETVMRETGPSIRTETYVSLVEDNVPGPDALAALQRKAPKQAAVYLDLLHAQPEASATALYDKHQVTAAVLAALERKRLVERIEREFFRAPGFEEDVKSREKFDLNEDQQAAYDAITGALGQGVFKTFLLEGITGSGKTEVYLQAIEHALAMGRDAILLVPEISLTPQTVGRLLGRFGQRIAVLHSGLGKGERYDEWRRAKEGEVHIVVGARSAVFAPLPDLGIIVVDEEHDTSYKQADTPRYHARDVAVMRSVTAHAVCVLGSATPSIESRHNSLRGKSVRLELRRRATNARLPEVRVIDMRKVAKEHAGECILSPVLEEEVKGRVAAGEQVLLLLNRRGHSPFVLCPQCGWTAGCENCNVSLTYHSRGAFLSCHYCNARQPVPPVCGECGFNKLVFLGTGTQKAEDFLQRAFAGARVARMDADTTSGKGGHAKILGRFAAGEIDILIGTQMIAKGHDYPGITLVGVINADTGLRVPDFRAAENTFQLITQVAGRAGRGDLPGTVIVQTYRPGHYAIEAAARHDYGAFYEREIAEREAAGYPPLRRMGNLAVESEDLLLAEKHTAVLHRILRQQIDALGFRGIEVLGPAPAVISRVKKRYRWNIAILSKSAKRLNTLARACRTRFTEETKTGKVSLKVDLDPYGMF